MPLALALLLLLVACHDSVTGPTSVLPVVQQQWKLAQGDLASKYGERVWHIQPTFFNWRQTDGMFLCSGDLTCGCFESGRRLITWCESEPYVIRHEARHAILWRLGSPDWRTYGH